MNTKTKAALLFLLPLALPLSAQQTARETFLPVVEKLRTAFFDSEEAESQELKALAEKWDSAYVPAYQRKRFFLDVLDAYVAKGFSAKKMRSYVGKSLRRLYPTYEDHDLEVVKKNAAVVGLFEANLLTMKYPFPLNENTFLYDELQEYGLKDSLKIGEIGAGSGLVSLLIASAYGHLESYINELDKERADNIQQKISHFPTILPSNKLHVVQGDAKSTHLEDKELDLIFMRETFHHFGEKKAMLQSIYRSLKPHGTVIVAEEVLDHEVDSVKCAAAVRKADVIGFFQKNGFIYVQGMENGDDYIFKFRKQ